MLICASSHVPYKENQMEKEYVQIEKQEYINLLVTIENLKHEIDMILQSIDEVIKVNG